MEKVIEVLKCLCCCSCCECCPCSPCQKPDPTPANEQPNNATANNRSDQALNKEIHNKPSVATNNQSRRAPSHGIYDELSTPQHLNERSPPLPTKDQPGRAQNNEIHDELSTFQPLDEPTDNDLFGRAPSNEIHKEKLDKSTTTKAILLQERNLWKEAFDSLAEEYKPSKWPPKDWPPLESDPKEILQHVTMEKDRCLKKQLTVKIAGKEINLRESLTKIVGWVQKFAMVGDTVVQYDPGHAALPWAGFRFLLQLVANETNTYASMLYGLERVSWLIYYCTDHERLFRLQYADKASSSEAFLTDLVSVYREILRFLFKADRFYERKATIRTIVTALQIDSWHRELIEAIDKRKESMESNSDLASKDSTRMDLDKIIQELQPLKRIEETIAHIAEIYQDEERQKYWRWISEINYVNHHNTNSKDVLDGTGKWLTDREEFKKWMDGSSAFWLHGIPGSGKTKLTSIVIEYLKGASHNVAYFYCMKDNNQPERGDPEQILAAILKQLVWSLPKHLCDPVEALYQELLSEAEGDVSQVGKLTLGQCVDMILKVTDENRAIIVIDALDECEEDKRCQLFDVIERILERKGNHTRIFLSSRDDGDIKLFCSNFTKVLIDSSSNKTDINNFINKETATAIKRGRLPQALKDRIIKELQRGAGGMFLWVKLQISALCAMKVASDIERRLGYLPKTLSHLYREIYDRIERPGEEWTSKEANKGMLIAKSTFMWLLYAKRQLSIPDFLAIMASSAKISLSEVTEDTILDLCCNLVIRNVASNSFTFAHLSVREFLESLKEYAPGKGHATIATFCIKRFTIESSLPNEEAFAYASLYWPEHYISADKLFNNEARSAAKILFSSTTAFSAWEDSARAAKKTLSWGTELQRKFEDAKFDPFLTICVFGLVDLLDTNNFSKDPQVGFRLALKWKHQEVVHLLFGTLFKLSDIGIEPGILLPILISFRWFGLMETLLKKQESVDTLGETDWKPLHWVVFFKSSEGVAYLINKDNGAACNAQDKDGRTPLHLAAINGDQTGLELLLKNDAKKNIADKNGWIPWHWASCLKREEMTGKLSTIDNQSGDNEEFIWNSKVRN